ncbi:MAG: hypothetical protein QXD58_01230 [Candidatus Micrarchaeaceae archaeon]
MENHDDGWTIVEFYRNSNKNLPPQYANMLVSDYTNEFMRVFRTHEIDKSYGSALQSTHSGWHSFVGFFDATEVLAYAVVQMQHFNKQLLLLRGTIHELAKNGQVNVSIWHSENSAVLKRIKNIVEYSIEYGGECSMRLLLTVNRKDRIIYYNHNIGLPDDKGNVLIIYAPFSAVANAFKVSQSTLEYFGKQQQTQSNLDAFYNLKRE